MKIVKIIKLGMALFYTNTIHGEPHTDFRGRSPRRAISLSVVKDYVKSGEGISGIEAKSFLKEIEKQYPEDSI